ncbi:MAG TPA: N-acetylmuramoyl-L-alanine amidase, partial [Longimicrobiales bacterium]|nr:N-acetylmuramoyl-L-alanine amidase [Longimicrobiales bacterium]
PGTPYHWAFPTGTHLPITGERPGAYRVRLTEDLSIWVAASRVNLLPRGGDDVRGAVGTVRVTPYAGYDEVRIATSRRFPFHVEAGERSLALSVFGARSRTNWMYLPTDGSLLAGMQWSQPSEDEWRLEIDLGPRLWGWSTAWADNGDLLLRVRRPPAIDPSSPLRGIVVAVDAGHPPGGAIGPTRLTEAEANLAIVKRMIPLLRDAGATIVEPRPDTAALGLYERVVAAEQGGAHLFVSVHNNAFGDGVNPFERAGTSVLYNRPQALLLSRHLQRQLLGELGLRDLGVIRADIAVIRHNAWMPAALTETMFLMVPRQEAALRDAGVQERIARAHVRALEAYLRERAERP